MSFKIKNRARVRFEFQDEAGQFVDPAIVRVKVRDPKTLVITTYTHPTAEITKDAQGKYHIDILLTKPGDWLVFGIGESSNEAADDVSIHVPSSPFYDDNGDPL